MARLSVEHYRANVNMTPEHVRKTGRLRDMFKSRSSVGPSTPNTATKSSTGPSTRSPPISPMSPSVKPGFETVGLLPSERQSLVDVKSQLQHNGGKRVAEALEQHDNELTGISTVPTADTSLGASGAGYVNKDLHGNDEVQKDDEVNVIAKAFQDALLKHREEQAACDMNAAEEGSSTLQWPARHTSRPVHRTSLDQLLALSQNGTVVTEDDNHTFFGSNGDHRVSEKSKYQKHLSEGTPGAAETQVQDSDVVQKSGIRSSQVHDLVVTPLSKVIQGPGKMGSGTLNRKMLSHAGDDTPMGDSSYHSDHYIGDDTPAETQALTCDEPLSQIVREFIASEVAEAIKEHARQHAKDAETSHTPPKHINLRMDMTIPERIATPTKRTVATHRTKMFGGPKSLANITITNPFAAIALQLLVIFYYFELALRVLVHGPASMFTSLLMFSLVIIAYAALMAQIGDNVTGSDLLFTPLEYVRDLSMEIVYRGVGMVFNILVDMLVDALRVLSEEKIMEVETDEGVLD